MAMRRSSSAPLADASARHGLRSLPTLKSIDNAIEAGASNDCAFSAPCRRRRRPSSSALIPDDLLRERPPRIAGAAGRPSPDSRCRRQMIFITASRRALAILAAGGAAPAGGRGQFQHAAHAAGDDDDAARCALSAHDCRHMLLGDFQRQGDGPPPAGLCRGAVGFIASASRGKWPSPARRRFLAGRVKRASSRASTAGRRFSMTAGMPSRYFNDAVATGRQGRPGAMFSRRAAMPMPFHCLRLPERGPMIGAGVTGRLAAAKCSRRKASWAGHSRSCCRWATQRIIGLSASHGAIRPARRGAALIATTIFWRRRRGRRFRGRSPFSSVDAQDGGFTLGPRR